MAKGRILSGMRPSGRLHVGHLVGVLNNWEKLQDEYECFYMIADWHALTSEYADTGGLQSNIREMLVDWLACGLDPERAVLFRQSDVKEHAELFLLFSMVTPLGWLTGCPTYKEQMKEVKQRDLSTFGFLGYPVLQAADILIYRADTVPVGEDQLPHVEMTREIARRFNNFFATDEKPLFPEPKSKLSSAPRLPGIDGRKMSKAYNNCIFLGDDLKAIKKKVNLMYTDPKKIHRDDIGHPEECVPHAFHKVLTPECGDMVGECKKGKLGCVKCKSVLVENLDKLLAPVREKREKMLNENPKIVDDILEQGRKKAHEVAEKTLEDVRRAVRI